jgi:hypothetical protein
MPRFGPGPNPAVDALRTTLDDPGLRGLTAAWFAVVAGKWAFLVTTLIVAYELGGAFAVGLLGLARYLTPTLIAPFAGLPTVRWRPEVVLRTVNAIRAVAVGVGAAGVALGIPIQLLFAVVALEAGVGAFSRPLHMPRTAAVRARGPVTAFSLGRAAFLEAVVGHATSRAAATSRVQARLAADSERPALH